MSYYGNHEQAAADAKKADKQIDGLDPASTSPVQSGAGLEGAASMEGVGSSEFTKSRTRPGWKGNQDISNKRERK